MSVNEEIKKWWRKPEAFPQRKPTGTRCPLQNHMPPCTHEACGFWDDLAECCSVKNMSQNLEKLFLKGSL